MNTKTLKENLLIALENRKGIVTLACKDVNISRVTFYRWYNNKKKFKKAVDKIKDMQIEVVKADEQIANEKEKVEKIIQDAINELQGIFPSEYSIELNLEADEMLMMDGKKIKWYYPKLRISKEL